MQGERNTEIQKSFSGLCPERQALKQKQTKQPPPPKKNPTPPTNPQNKHLCLTLAEQNLSVSDYNYFCFLVIIDPLAAWL